MSGFRSFLSHFLFFLTGLLFLICMIAWMEILSTIIGNTPATVCLSLAVFAAGSTIGNILVVRSRIRHANGWRAFAVLQLAIAGYAVLTPFWKVTVDAMYSRIHSLSPVVKVIPAFSLLFFPAVVAGMLL